MEIRENEKVCIFAPLSPKLEKYECSRILDKISKENREIALDLRFVQDCTIDFIETLKEIGSMRKIGVFNIPSDIFVLFNIMHIDKSVRLFVCEPDFEENSRQLINRQFSVYSSMSA